MRLEDEAGLLLVGEEVRRKLPLGREGLTLEWEALERAKGQSRVIVLRGIYFLLDIYYNN